MHEVNIAKEHAGYATCRKKKSDKDCRKLRERKLQKKVQNVADGKGQLHDGFPELQDNQKSTISAILTNPAIISGHHFEHMWFVDNLNVLYQVHVVSVKCSKQSKVPKVTATDWMKEMT